MTENLIRDAAMGSTAVQDYIKFIYKLQHGGHEATTSAIAERLGISSASVTGMLKKLSKMGLLTYHPYQAVELTEPGRKIALEMIRHHRLIELYLQEALGFSWDQVDAEAERLEHHISEEMEAAMARFLGDPTEDPHGDPIPTKDGYMSDVRYDRLSDVTPGCTVRIRRVSDKSPELLRYLAELGMTLRVTVEVVERAPFDGPLSVRVAGSEHSLGAQVTDSIFVETLTEAPCVAG